jgi:preprotein translocase subunit SecD
MMIKPARFNIYLCAALALVLASGCQLFQSQDDKDSKDKDSKTDTPEDKKEKKEVSTVSLHLEADPDGISDIVTVSIYRADPIEVSMRKEPFLDSRELDEAKVMDEPGGLFSIRLKFNWEGTAMLDSFTSSNPGRRIGIYGDFKEKRWLASPVIHQRISNGVLTFTPDATREEAERIVRGLNNVAREVKKGEKNESKF